MAHFYWWLVDAAALVLWATYTGWLLAAGAGEGFGPAGGPGRGSAS